MAKLGLAVQYVDGQEYIDMLKKQEADIVNLETMLGWK